MGFTICPAARLIITIPIKRETTAVHPNGAYGYVNDEPVSIQNLTGNPYGELVPMLKGGVCLFSRLV